MAALPTNASRTPPRTEQRDDPTDVRDPKLWHPGHVVARTR